MPIFTAALDRLFRGELDAKTTSQLQAEADEIGIIEANNPAKVISSEAVHAWLRSWGSDDELPPPKAGQ